MVHIPGWCISGFIRVDAIITASPLFITSRTTSPTTIGEQKAIFENLPRIIIEGYNILLDLRQDQYRGKAMYVLSLIKGTEVHKEAMHINRSRLLKASSSSVNQMTYIIAIALAVLAGVKKGAIYRSVVLNAPYTRYKEDHSLTKMCGFQIKFMVMSRH